MGLPSHFCIYIYSVTNWHRKNLRSDRGKQGKQLEFETKTLDSIPNNVQGLGLGLSRYNRVPTPQGKQGKLPKKNPCQGKHREFGNFAKTQGIWFAQVVNSLFDICRENFHFFGGAG